MNFQKSFSIFVVLIFVFVVSSNIFAETTSVGTIQNAAVGNAEGHELPNPIMVLPFIILLGMSIILPSLLGKALS